MLFQEELRKARAMRFNLGEKGTTADILGITEEKKKKRAERFASAADKEQQERLEKRMKRFGPVK